MIKVEEAYKLIQNAISSLLPCEEISINNALYRILREDIVSDINIPPFDNSAMDGYAVCATDLKKATMQATVNLKIIEDIPAGYIPKKTVKSGEASVIMTGAPMPEGADSVVIIEHTNLSSSNEVEIFFPGKVGDNIRRKGEDVKNGEKVLEAGISIKPADLGLLASLGKSKIKVSKKPRVAILTSGDELVDIDSEIEPGKIRSSNNHLLSGLVLKYGGIPLNIGIAKDNLKSVINHLNMAKEADIIVTTGGVSVGKYDVVKEALQSLGGEFQFWKVAMKPGKPLAFSVWEGRPVFGLPGNPISSYIGFEQFVRPAMLKMLGKNNVKPTTIIAILDNDIEKKKGIRYFARGRVYVENGVLRVCVIGPHGSNMLKPLSRSNGLIVLPEDSVGEKQGQKVEVQLIESIEEIL